MSFQGTDTINGGEGTDNLYIQAGAAGTYQAASITNVEKISTNFSAGSTINLLNVSGLTEVANDGSSADGIYSNLGSTSIGLRASNISESATFGFASAVVSGSSDTATLTLQNISHTTSNGTDKITVAGIETLNLVSSLGPNVVDTLETTTTSKLNVSGDQSLNLQAALNATITQVDASASTGGVAATFAAIAAGTMTGGAGNDTLDVSSVTGNASVAGGAGNDTLTLGNKLTNTDTVDGGDGIDTLSTTANEAETYTKPTTATISNVEALTLTDQASSGATLTLDNLANGINTVTLGNGTAGAYGIIGPASTLTVNVGDTVNTDDLSGTLTLTDTGTGISDSATLANTVTVANDTFNTKNVVSDGYETLTINTKGGTSSANTTKQTLGTVTINQDSGGTAKLVITGANSLDVTTVTANEIDASGLTGTAAFKNTGATSVTKITGSTNDDTLVGSSTATSIDGGAGHDSITGGAGNDTLVGSDGNDTITAAAGNDSINGGAGNDRIIFAADADFTKNDTVDGGDGTADTLVMTKTAQTNLTETLTTVSNIEVLEISDALAGATINMARFGTTSPTTVKLAAAAETSAISNMAANTTLELTTVNASATLTATNATDTAADTLGLKLNSATGVDFGTVTATAFETFNINSTTTGNAPSTYTNQLALNTTSGTSINVTGNVALQLSTASSATAVNTINASGMTGGGLQANNTYSSVASTLTGSAYADTLIGGAANDTISGGDSADSLVGGSGSDSLVGGTGEDTLDGGANNDTLQGGEGNDSFISSGGSDNIDGGNGTDKLTISASFTNISGHTLTSIEKLDMDNLAATMSVAQFAGFSEIVGGGVVTFSDAGTITANTGVTAYKLADGTNTFTASTTAANNSVEGGTGSDTINFNASVYSGATGADTVLGGTGTDTLNVTGNTALSFTYAATTLTGIEQINFSNSTADITITTNDANVASGATLRVDASSLTNGGNLNWNGGDEADGKFNIVGGADMDTINGGAGADTLEGGSGNDVLKGDEEADYLSGGAGDDFLQEALANTENSVDTLVGGIGNDTYYIVDGGNADVITDAASGGTADTLLIANGENASSIVVNGAADLLGASNAGIEQIVTEGTAATLSAAQVTGNALNISEDASNATTLLTIAGTGTADTIDLSSLTFTANTYVGASGAAVTGTAFTSGTDFLVINGGDGGDTMTLSSHSDRVVFGSATQTGDNVVSFNAGTNATSVDIIAFDIDGSGETGAFATGAASTSIVAANTSGAASAVTAGAVAIDSYATGDGDDHAIANGASLIVFTDLTSASAIQTAIQTAGSSTLTVGTSSSDGYMLALYDKGADLGLAVINLNNVTTTNGATVTEIATIGIADLTNINAGDFLYV